MIETACRACGGVLGSVVLDLGEQPASDFFPQVGDPGPDPVYPLQMWLCSACGLAQLAADPTVPAEPRGAEPAALVAQAADAVNRVQVAGLMPAGATVAEYGSPHGGSWLELAANSGLKPVSAGPADVIIDCFGLMHAPDQHAAMAERVSRLTSGGVLLLQYHSLETIITDGQWNALRHGHYAYYSTTALARLLAANGLRPRTVWRFDLYGGTVLLAASRAADGRADPDAAVRSLLDEEARVGVCDPAVVSGLQRGMQRRAKALRDWLAAERSAGRSVLGYGAASRAVALLCRAGINSALLPGIADASSAKHGLRMPGTDVPVLDTAVLRTDRPDSVLVFVADLLGEVRMAFPEVEAAGGRWVVADAIDS
jgi:C-methyltransferase C-terminal domain/Putative zinc binding domain/Methyltransferase domain